MCIRHSTYIKWKSGHWSILIPLLIVSRLRTTAYAYKLLFLFNAKIFWIMLSLFFFSFFSSSRNCVQTEGYNTHLKWLCFSLFIYIIVKYEGDLSIIIINAKQTVIKLILYYCLLCVFISFSYFNLLSVLQTFVK